jgi:segregation and condensation protein A
VKAWTIHTDIFEGPLDLLLYLVRRDNIDIKLISVAEIADSYVAYLDRMRDVNLAVAGDYLVMAATLIHLKSLELLPRPPTLQSEEDEDPREALARQLQEYARYKAAARQLQHRPLLNRDTFARPPEEGDHSSTLELDAFALLDVYHGLLTREEIPEPVFAISDDGHPDFEDCCRYVLHQLGGPGGKGELATLLKGLSTRLERVVTFVAILELTRLQWVELHQRRHLGPVRLVGQVDANVDLAEIHGRLTTRAAIA